MGSKETMAELRKQRTAVRKAVEHREAEETRAREIIAAAKVKEKEAKARMQAATEELLRDVESENRDAIDNLTDAPEPEKAWVA